MNSVRITLANEKEGLVSIGVDALITAWCAGSQRCPLAVFVRVLAGEPISSIQGSLPDHLDAAQGFVQQATLILPHVDRRLPGGVRATAKRMNAVRALDAKCVLVLEQQPQLRLTGALPAATPPDCARHRTDRERADRAAALREQGMPWGRIGAQIGVSAERARQIVRGRQIAVRRCAALPAVDDSQPNVATTTCD